MPKVTADIVDGAEVSDNVNGFAVVRKFLVEGLQGALPNRLNDALSTTGIPQRSEFHPTLQNHQVTSRSCSPASRDNKTAFVTVNYKVFNVKDREPNDADPTVISIGTNLQETVTSFDASGDQIILNHRRIITNELGQATGIQVFPSQTGSVRKQIPHSVARFSRKESEDPFKKALLFIGSVNSTRFLDQRARTWLCTAIDGTTSNGGEDYDVVYEFEHNEDSWDTTVIYIDPETNEPVVDPIPFESIKQIQVYQAINFLRLDLKSQQRGPIF